MTLPCVVIAGATGFVGNAIAPALSKRFKLVGLSRGAKRDDAHYIYRQCDLFSLLDVERALEGARYAVYLVHSMMPSARLTQGSFRDLDLVCADNFARAARQAGVEHIVYLGGLAPTGDSMSEHLASRIEVERVLGAYGVPVTTLRAGLVIGQNGSSYQMLVRLVRRLPIMVCPRWTSTPTQPVALQDVVDMIDFSVGRASLFGQSYDLGCPEVLSYREMMRRTADRLGLKRPMLSVPLFSPGLSRLWVSVMTGAPRALVAPLVQSLKHAMVARDQQIYDLAGVAPRSFDDAMQAALMEEESATTSDAPAAFTATQLPSRPTVRSVQRLSLPPGKDAVWAANEYMRWLPHAMRPFVTVETSDEMCRFYARGIRSALLELKVAADRSSSDRQLLYVVGGLLARGEGRGRLEFRMIPGRDEVLCALHEFLPRLPWYLYVGTQAVAHLLVVRAFGRHLMRLSRLAQRAI